MENKKNIYKALASFTQEVPVIHKGTKGYGYSYTDLPAIFEVINPLLKKNGLGFTQLVNGNEIVTVLFHVETGETIESKTEIPQNVELAKMNQFQVLGSAITYIRRYALSAMLGLVTDKDTDASGEQKPQKPLTKEDLEKLASTLIAIEDVNKLTKLYNSDPRYKTNKEAVDLFKNRHIEIK